MATIRYKQGMKQFARFSAPLSDGGTATWKAEIVKIQDGIAYVRHPRRARAFPFSPVKAPGLYKYKVENLTILKAS